MRKNQILLFFLLSKILLIKYISSAEVELVTLEIPNIVNSIKTSPYSNRWDIIPNKKDEKGGDGIYIYDTKLLPLIPSDILSTYFENQNITMRKIIGYKLKYEIVVSDLGFPVFINCINNTFLIDLGKYSTGAICSNSKKKIDVGKTKIFYENNFTNYIEIENIITIENRIQLYGALVDTPTRITGHSIELFLLKEEENIPTEESSSSTLSSTTTEEKTTEDTTTSSTFTFSSTTTEENTENPSTSTLSSTTTEENTENPSTSTLSSTTTEEKTNDATTSPSSTFSSTSTEEKTSSTYQESTYTKTEISSENNQSSTDSEESNQHKSNFKKKIIISVFVINVFCICFFLIFYLIYSIFIVKNNPETNLQKKLDLVNSDNDYLIDTGNNYDIEVPFLVLNKQKNNFVNHEYMCPIKSRILFQETQYYMLSGKGTFFSCLQTGKNFFDVSCRKYFVSNIFKAILFLIDSNMMHIKLDPTNVFLFYEPQTTSFSVKLGGYEYIYCGLKDKNIIINDSMSLNHRFLPLETLTENIYTKKSMSWSFYCLIWSILNMKEPWSLLSKKDLLTHMKNESKLYFDNEQFLLNAEFNEFIENISITNIQLRLDPLHFHKYSSMI